MTIGRLRAPSISRAWPSDCWQQFAVVSKVLHKKREVVNQFVLRIKLPPSLGGPACPNYTYSETENRKKEAGDKKNFGNILVYD